MAPLGPANVLAIRLDLKFCESYSVARRFLSDVNSDLNPHPSLGFSNLLRLLNPPFSNRFSLTFIDLNRSKVLNLISFVRAFLSFNFFLIQKIQTQQLENPPIQRSVSPPKSLAKSPPKRAPSLLNGLGLAFKNGFIGKELLNFWFQTSAMSSKVEILNFRI